MMRTIHRDIATVVIVSKDGKILQGIKASGGGVYPGCWVIPGGGVEEGETKEQALIREIKEETGLDISQYPMEFIDDSEGDTREKILRDTGEKVLCAMRFYRYQVNIPENAENILVTPGDDLVECKWFGPDEFQKFPITAPSEKLFRKLGYLP